MHRSSTAVTSQAHSWVCEECACEVCSHNSKPLANGGTHKFLHRRHACAPRARDTPVAARMTKTERRPRLLRPGHQAPYTHHLPWPGDQPGRPSWPWKCAHVRSTGMPRGRGRVLRGGIGGSLKCDFCVLSVPAAVGHRFMSILTRPNR